MNIKAIETRYAGCRFRSRLEARWAVFFDHLGIRWEYEPQGYVVGNRVRHGRPVPYLPDFWLPRIHDGVRTGGHGIWVEVKGILSPREADIVFGATWDETGLPADPAGTPLDDNADNRVAGNLQGNRNGPRVLLLGEIPAPGTGHLHHITWHHKGTVGLGHAEWAPGGSITVDYDVADFFVDDGEQDGPAYCLPAAVQACSAGWPPHPLVARAYVAARSARFEHGERG